MSKYSRILILDLDLSLSFECERGCDDTFDDGVLLSFLGIENLLLCSLLSQELISCLFPGGLGLSLLLVFGFSLLLEDLPEGLLKDLVLGTFLELMVVVDIVHGVKSVEVHDISEHIFVLATTVASARFIHRLIRQVFVASSVRDMLLAHATGIASVSLSLSSAFSLRTAPVFASDWVTG